MEVGVEGQMVLLGSLRFSSERFCKRENVSMSLSQVTYNEYSKILIVFIPST